MQKSNLIFEKFSKLEFLLFLINDTAKTLGFGIFICILQYQEISIFLRGEFVEGQVYKLLCRFQILCSSVIGKCMVSDLDLSFCEHFQVRRFFEVFVIVEDNNDLKHCCAVGLSYVLFRVCKFLLVYLISKFKQAVVQKMVVRGPTNRCELNQKWTYVNFFLERKPYKFLSFVFTQQKFSFWLFGYVVRATQIFFEVVQHF